MSIRSLIFDELAGTPRPLAAQAIEPVLPNVLDDMFRLMDLVGSDELLPCLEKLIQTFASSMAPFAQNMATRISDHFMRLVADGGEVEPSEEEEFEAVFAASQCLSALVCLTRAMRDNEDMHVIIQVSRPRRFPAQENGILARGVSCFTLLTLLQSPSAESAGAPPDEDASRGRVGPRGRPLSGGQGAGGGRSGASASIHGHAAQARPVHARHHPFCPQAWHGRGMLLVLRDTYHQKSSAQSFVWDAKQYGSGRGHPSPR